MQCLTCRKYLPNKGGGSCNYNCYFCYYNHSPVVSYSWNPCNGEEGGVLGPDSSFPINFLEGLDKSPLNSWDSVSSSASGVVHSLLQGWWTAPRFPGKWGASESWVFWSEGRPWSSHLFRTKNFMSIFPLLGQVKKCHLHMMVISHLKQPNSR